MVGQVVHRAATDAARALEAALSKAGDAIVAAQRVSQRCPETSNGDDAAAQREKRHALPRTTRTEIFFSSFFFLLLFSQ